MRVLILTTSWPHAPGDPAGHFVHTEARALAAVHDVTVIAPDAPAELPFDVIPIPGKGAFGWPGALARMRQNPLVLGGAASFIRSARRALATAGPFDRIIAHWAMPCGWPIATGALGEIEIVSHGSDVSLLASLPLPVRRRIVRAIATRARSWRFVSGVLLERMLRALPAEEAALTARIAVVRPCMIEVPDVRAAANEKQRQIGFPFVTAIGRLVPQKRTEHILEVAANERTPIVIVGDGPERSRLERMARGSITKFVGQVPRSEALAWLGASQSLWFASKIEGFPTVLREAEALGVPVRIL